MKRAIHTPRMAHNSSIALVAAGSQIIAVVIIQFAVAAQSADAGIAGSENVVHFFRRQLASATTTQYPVRHEFDSLNIKFPSSLPDKSKGYTSSILEVYRFGIHPKF